MADGISIARRAPKQAGGYDRVLAFMREELMSGRLKTGDRLLSERDLAEALEVSRPVVREALRALAAIGAIDIRRGHGAVVRKPDFSTLAEFFSLVLAQDQDIVDDVLEARIAIERHAVRLACQRASPADLDRLRRAYQRLVETIDDPMVGGAADFDFHAALVNAARSPVLASLYAAIADLIRRSQQVRRAEVTVLDGINEFLMDHHAAILKAILDRDPVRADALLVEHFDIGAELRRRVNIHETDRPRAERNGSPKPAAAGRRRAPSRPQPPPASRS